MHEFRSIFRDIINLMSQRKELISYIFMAGEEDAMHAEGAPIGY